MLEVIRESEWTPHEAALMAALAEVEADHCGGCGQPLSESLHVDGQPDPDYVDTSYECVGCKVSEQVRVNTEKSRARADGAKPDEVDRIKPNPEAWTKHVIRTRAEALALVAAQRAQTPTP